MGLFKPAADGETGKSTVTLLKGLAFLALLGIVLYVAVLQFIA
jgi:hypothetical protein